MAEVWAAELGLAGGAWSTSASAVVWAKVFRLITSKVYEGFSGLVARAKSRRRHRTSCETPVPDQMPRNSPDRRHTSKAGLLSLRTHRFSSRMRYCFEFT